MVMETRIQHIEDLGIWEGSEGFDKSLFILQHLDTLPITLKWDGSPAVIFGRDKNGFFFTDKNGYKAKSYNGKCRTPKEIYNMILNRVKGEPTIGRIKFAENMKNAFSIIEKAIPKNHIGEFIGDILFLNNPWKLNEDWLFKPNVVEYKINSNSNLGKKIEGKNIGIAIHKGDISVIDKNLDLLIIEPLKINFYHPILHTTIKNNINRVKFLINKSKYIINTLLDDDILKQKQISDFKNILYQYINWNINLRDLGINFNYWLTNISSVTNRKSKNIINHITQNENAIQCFWKIIKEIISMKNNIINILNQEPNGIKENINGHLGGEGYVIKYSHDRMVKLVNRKIFSQINRIEGVIHS